MSSFNSGKSLVLISLNAAFVYFYLSLSDILQTCRRLIYSPYFLFVHPYFFSISNLFSIFLICSPIFFFNLYFFMLSLNFLNLTSSSLFFSNYVESRDYLMFFRTIFFRIFNSTFSHTLLSSVEFVFIVSYSLRMLSLPSSL